METYERVLSCRSLSDVPAEILAPMADYLDAETGCFLQFLADDGGLRVGRNSCYNVPASAHRDYISHYFRADPAITSGRTQHDDLTSVFCTEEVCDYSAFTRGELYNDFFEPNRIHHVLVMMMRPDEYSADRLVLGFHRSKGAAPFTPEQTSRARRLAAAASSAVRSLTLQDTLTLRDETISRFEQAHPETGVVFFDTSLTLLSGNAKGLSDLKLGIHADAQETARLAQVHAACQELHDASDSDRNLSVRLSQDEGLMATVQMRPTPRGEVLFTVHTTGRDTEDTLRRRCADFGMTRREIDAVRLLSSGLSNNEIATRLFISPRTVENHFRSIYAKAGVNTRAQLLAQVLR